MLLHYISAKSKLKNIIINSKVERETWRLKEKKKKPHSEREIQGHILNIPNYAAAKYIVRKSWNIAKCRIWIPALRTQMLIDFFSSIDPLRYLLKSIEVERESVTSPLSFGCLSSLKWSNSPNKREQTGFFLWLKGIYFGDDYPSTFSDHV